MDTLDGVQSIIPWVWGALMGLQRARVMTNGSLKDKFEIY